MFGTIWPARLFVGGTAEIACFSRDIAASCLPLSLDSVEQSTFFDELPPTPIVMMTFVYGAEFK